MKKGDRVYLLSDWNRKGVIACHEYVVGSWGKKQGHLNHGDGTLGVRIYTDRVSDANLRRVEDVVDLRAWATEFGRAVIAAEKSHLSNCIARNADSAAYVAQMRKELAAVQDEPTFLSTAEHSERFAVLGLRGLVDVPAEVR